MPINTTTTTNKPKRNEIVTRDLEPTAYVGLSPFPENFAVSTVKLFRAAQAALFCRPHACQSGVSSILWHIAKADEVNAGSVNSNLLKFLYLFSMILNKDEAPHMYYGRQTSRLDINLTKTSRAVKICGVRYQNPMNARAVRAQSLLGSEEVLDATLLRKLVSFAKLFYFQLWLLY